jgi:prefoldin subunit 5
LTSQNSKADDRSCSLPQISISINFDDVEQRLKKQMDEMSASIKESQHRLSEAEVLVHRRLKEVKDYAERAAAQENEEKKPLTYSTSH